MVLLHSNKKALSVSLAVFLLLVSMAQFLLFLRLPSHGAEANSAPLGIQSTARLLQSPPSKQQRRPYMGILIDAGRFHFELDWLQEQVDFLQSIGLNLIHLRLSDDVLMQLNNDTTINKKWRQFIQYTKDHSNVTILPELDMPGHAASWPAEAVVPCPHYTCQHLFGVPLATDQDVTYTWVQLYIQLMVELFGDDDADSTTDNLPPSGWIHLGGDEVHTGNSCVKEAQAQQNYTYFEERLRQILQQENISIDRIVRWQETGVVRGRQQRVMGIQHYWQDAPRRTTAQQQQQPYMVSTGLYFDTVANQVYEPDAYDVYMRARRYVTDTNNHMLLAIIATAFELDADFYHRRNVQGKLIGLSMAHEDYADREAFVTAYHKRCTLEDSICAVLGKPLDDRVAMESQRKWNDVRKGVCEGLGLPHTLRASLNTHAFKIVGS